MDGPRGLIVGIGSPFGDDRLGWLAARALESHPGLRGLDPCPRVLVLDRPGPGLLVHLRGVPWALVLDAVRSGHPPGTLHQVDRQTLLGVPVSLSSHALGLAQTLALGAVLGDLPERLWLLGLEAQYSEGTGEEVLSSPVVAALPALIETALARVRALHGNCGFFRPVPIDPEMGK